MSPKHDASRNGEARRECAAKEKRSDDAEGGLRVGGGWVDLTKVLPTHLETARPLRPIYPGSNTLPESVAERADHQRSRLARPSTGREREWM